MRYTILGISDEKISIDDVVNLLSIYNVDDGLYDTYKKLDAQLKIDEISRQIINKRFKKRKDPYEIYKTRWIIEHITLKKYLECFDEYRKETEEKDLKEVYNQYKELIEECGIKGSLYVCKDEFYHNEFKNEK